MPSICRCRKRRQRTCKVSVSDQTRCLVGQTSETIITLGYSVFQKIVTNLTFNLVTFKFCKIINYLSGQNRYAVSIQIPVAKPRLRLLASAHVSAPKHHCICRKLEYSVFSMIRSARTCFYESPHESIVLQTPCFTASTEITSSPELIVEKYIIGRIEPKKITPTKDQNLSIIKPSIFYQHRLL